MSLKSRTEKLGRLVVCRGLLAASARDPETILRMQFEITSDLQHTISKYAAFQIPQTLVDLLIQMLAWDPCRRISPSQALSHDFFKL